MTFPGLPTRRGLASRGRAKLRLAALVLGVVALFALVALTVTHSPSAVRDAVAGFGWAAPLIFIGIWAVLTPPLFSGTLLATAAGLLFGPGLGTGVAVAGATLGGVLSFLLARRFGQGAAEELVGAGRVASVKERIERRGFVAVLLARATPGMPATILNWVLGLSRVRLRDFVGGIALGGAPHAFVYTALGGSLATLNFASPAAIVAILLYVGMAVAGIVVAWRQRRARRAAAARPEPVPALAA